MHTTDATDLDRQKKEDEARKAAAEAALAELELKKANRLESEELEPGAVQLREADRKAKIAAAEKDEAAAKRAQVSAFLPDLKDVDTGSLENKSDKPAFQTALVQRALAAAAKSLAPEILASLNGTIVAPAQADGAAQDPSRVNGPPPGRAWKLLVTSDAELATSDSTYLDVTAGLDQLIAAADAALVEPVTTPVITTEINEPEQPPEEVAPGLPTGAPEEAVAEAIVGPVAGAALEAAAGAIPALLGAFSARRTLTSSDVTPNDLATAASVVKELLKGEAGHAIVHDSFRLLPPGEVHTKHAQLVDLRTKLLLLKLKLEHETSVASNNGASAADGAAQLRKSRADRVDSVSAAIDTFLGTLVEVPKGGTRSPLSAAAAREQLHGNGESAFTHVLLVKSEGGSVFQSVDDKPFLMDDKLSVLASASASWMVIEVTTSAVKGAGTEGGLATAHGKIGDRIDLGFDEQLQRAASIGSP